MLSASQSLVPDIRVASESNHVWVTWIDSRTRVGWVEWRDGAFGSAQYRTLDPSLGYEGVRALIREDVLSH
jgi:hypothetical protein